jgi:hypothetical protein
MDRQRWIANDGLPTMDCQRLIGGRGMMKIGASGRRSESEREYTILALTKPNSAGLTEEAWRHIKNLSRQRYARAFSYFLTNAN